MTDILIIGAGASGLAAAIAAADADPAASVLLLGGLDRAGKKLLATGNGKCNLTNRLISPDCYHTRAPARLARWLESMPPEATLDFFADLGLTCMEDEAGRCYPYARQAAMVSDVLRLALARRGNITLRCGCRVRQLRQERGRFTAVTESGERFTAARVILTAGGRAAPKQGSDGSGFALARMLGHTCTPIAPALVPLRCAGRWWKTLKGLRHLCRATLWQGKRRLGAEQGEVQFTDCGLSGIPIFQLSCLLTGENEITLDFTPERPYDELRADFRRRALAHPRESVEDALLGLLPRRLQYCLLRDAGIDPTAPVQTLSRRDMETLAGLYKRWPCPVQGTLGWEQAQVTLGGVPLEEVGEDFASRLVPGLYLAGEVLDVTGDCGGYNLHWAWCSGGAAGRAAAEGRTNHAQ